VRIDIGPAFGRYHLVFDASAQNAPAWNAPLDQNTAAVTLHANPSGAVPAAGWHLTFHHKRIAGETNQHSLTTTRGQPAIA